MESVVLLSLILIIALVDFGHTSLSPTVSRQHCTYRGTTYKQGETWTDGCKYSCLCVNEFTGYYRCLSKCPMYRDIPPNCTLEKPPGECCEKLVCTTTATDKSHENMCKYGDAYYREGDTWQDGCKSTCSCVDGSIGHYKCDSLCPMYTQIPPGCTLQSKPGECCAKLICKSNGLMTENGGKTLSGMGGNIFTTGASGTTVNTHAMGANTIATSNIASKLGHGTASSKIASMLGQGLTSSDTASIGSSDIASMLGQGLTSSDIASIGSSDIARMLGQGKSISKVVIVGNSDNTNMLGSGTASSKIASMVSHGTSSLDIGSIGSSDIARMLGQGKSISNVADIGNSDIASTIGHGKASSDIASKLGRGTAFSNVASIGSSDIANMLGQGTAIPNVANMPGQGTASIGRSDIASMIGHGTAFSNVASIGRSDIASMVGQGTAIPNVANMPGQGTASIGRSDIASMLGRGTAISNVASMSGQGTASIGSQDIASIPGQGTGISNVASIPGQGTVSGKEYCVYDSKKYRQGETWEDGCKYTCQCVDAQTGYYTCNTACPKWTNIPKGCTLETQPGECCEKPVCNGIVLPTGPGNTLNVCKYGDGYYREGDTWQDGCKYTCTCLDGSTGRYRCDPLCNKYSHLSEGCYLRSKPGECCAQLECLSGKGQDGGVVIDRSGTIFGSMIADMSGTGQVGSMTQGMSGTGQVGPMTTGMSGTGQVGSMTTGMSGTGQVGSMTTGMSETGQDGSMTTGMSGTGQVGSMTTGMSGTGQVGSMTTGMSGTGQVGSMTPGMSGTGQVGPMTPGMSGTGHVGSMTPGMSGTGQVSSMTPGMRETVKFGRVPAGISETGQVGSMQPGMGGSGQAGSITGGSIQSGLAGSGTMFSKDSSLTQLSSTMLGSGMMNTCIYGGKHYKQDDTWQDECKYTCECVDAQIGYYKCIPMYIECRKWTNISPGCTLETPPGECCERLVCNGVVMQNTDIASAGKIPLMANDKSVSGRGKVRITPRVADSRTTDTGTGTAGFMLQGHGTKTVGVDSFNTASDTFFTNSEGARTAGFGPRKPVVKAFVHQPVGVGSTGTGTNIVDGVRKEGTSKLDIALNTIGFASQGFASQTSPTDTGTMGTDVAKSQSLTMTANSVDMGAQPVSTCDGSYSDPFGDYTATWKFNAATNKITFTLSARLSTTEPQWLAIGMNTIQQMNGTDADGYIAWVIDGIATVSDRYMLEQEEPFVDPAQNVENVSGYVTDGVTYVTFTRALNTGDYENDFIFDGSNCAYFTYAWGGDVYADGSFGYHAERDVSSVTYCFTNCAGPGSGLTGVMGIAESGTGQAVAEPVVSITDAVQMGGSGSPKVMVMAAGSTGQAVPEPVVSSTGDVHMGGFGSPVVTGMASGSTGRAIAEPVVSSTGGVHMDGSGSPVVTGIAAGGTGQAAAKPFISSTGGVHMGGFGAPEVTGAQPVSTCDGSYSDPFGDYTATWKFNAATNKITFTLSARLSTIEPQWLAIGMNTIQQMNGTDADGYIAWVIDGIATVSDRYMLEQEEPFVDPAQNVENVSGYVTDGVTYVTFTRALNTGDYENDFIFDGSNCAYFTYAWGGDVYADGSVGYHAERDVSSVSYCFTNCAGPGSGLTGVMGIAESGTGQAVAEPVVSITDAVQMGGSGSPKVMGMAAGSTGQEVPGPVVSSTGGVHMDGSGSPVVTGIAAGSTGQAVPEPVVSSTGGVHMDGSGSPVVTGIAAGSTRQAAAKPFISSTGGVHMGGFGAPEVTGI